ncbi:Spore coat protein SA [compost metagenome]
MGKPIVTTDTVGCKEVVEEGRNGFLVPVRNVEALVERIRLLIEDAGLRETMGQESRRKAVEEFDIERVVEQYLALYGEYYAV